MQCKRHSTCSCYNCRIVPASKPNRTPAFFPPLGKSLLGNWWVTFLSNLLSLLTERVGYHEQRVQRLPLATRSFFTFTPPNKVTYEWSCRESWRDYELCLPQSQVELNNRCLVALAEFWNLSTGRACVQLSQNLSRCGLQGPKERRHSKIQIHWNTNICFCICPSSVFRYSSK